MEAAKQAGLTKKYSFPFKTGNKVKCVLNNALVARYMHLFEPYAIVESCRKDKKSGRHNVKIKGYENLLFDASDLYRVDLEEMIARRKEYVKEYGQINKERKRDYDQEYAKINKERKLSVSIKYRQENKEAIRERKRSHYYANKHKYNEQSRKQRLKDRFGLTIEEYNLLLESQDCVCKICGENRLTKNQTRMGVDHCHDSGSIRGILCSNCNTALGYFSDNIQLLKKAIEYILVNGSDIPEKLKVKRCKTY